LIKADALITVDFAPAPVRVKVLIIVICSVSVPGSTLIVSPALAASIAPCNVGKLFGTVILAALAVGSG
jgi:hypothetical protein